MKRTRTDSSRLGDARLRALLKGLREDMAPPPGFSARVLASLRAEGLLADEPARASEPDAASWWVRLGAALFAAPRWGVAAGAALALAVAAGIAVRPGAPGVAESARPPAPASVSVRPSVPSLPSALAAERPRQGGAVLASAQVRPLLGHAVSLETVVASSGVAAAGVASSGVAAAGPAALRGASDSVDASASAPAMGRGSVAPRTASVQAGSGVVVSGGGAGLSGAVSSASVAGSSGGPAPLSSGGGPRAADSPLSKATPTPPPSGVTPAPSLAQNSQVRNNVILASRGQNAQILFKVAQAGQVLVAIYNRLGQRVAVLQNGPLGPGQYDLSWAGQSGFGGLAASGIYEVVVQTPTYTDLHKMMLVK